MSSDPLLRIFEVVNALIAIVILLKPNWLVRLITYGRKGIDDVDKRIFAGLKIAAIIVIIWAVTDLIAWLLVREVGAH